MKLQNKVALITGSGRNIGPAIALELAREGANVVVNAKSNLEEAESMPAEDIIRSQKNPVCQAG